MPADKVAIRWAPKVRQAHIRRMYEMDAQGMLDEDLVDEVGYGLYARCLSILEATEAAKGRAKCRTCGAIISHQAGREEVLRCAGCGWAVAWGHYHRSYRGKQLLGGAALHIFEEFVERFALARSPRDRILLIDRVIHEFHWNLTHKDPEPRRGRPTAANLIEGERMRDVVAFLNTLAGP